MPRVYVRKRETKYTLQDIHNAVRDVTEKRKTYRQAADTYNVPIKVIFDRIKGRKVNIERMGAGVQRVLPEKIEEYIVSCLKTRAQMGHPCQKEELKLLIKEYVEIKELKTPFKDNKPGDDWYFAFMRRHPGLTLKKPEHLQKARVDARKPYIVYDFYNTLKCVVNENNLEDKPEFIYNCDESGFQSDPSRVRGIGEKGKPLSRVSGGSGRDSTTVLACVSAKGHVLPPLIVYKGAAVQARWTSEKAYPNTQYAATTKGWMEEPVFFGWFKKSFIPHIHKLREDQNEPNQKALLIYDGHCSHISLRIIEEAEKNNIILVKFPSHLTDRIQPLDKCVFGPLKKAWDKKLVENGIKQMGVGSGRLSRAHFTELLGEIYQETMKPDNIISGFKTTGLYPVDASKFPKQLFKSEDLQMYTNIINDNIQLNYQETLNETEQQQVTTTLNENYRNEINSNQTGKQHITTQYVTQKTNETSETIYSLNNSNMLKENGKNIDNEQILIPQTENNISSQQVAVGVANRAEQLSESSLPSTSKNCDMIDNNYSSPLINQILKLISLDTGTADHIKRKITSAFIDSVASDEEIKSPSKAQLENIFGIKPVKKVVIPRLKQCSYGEVLTTNEVKERLIKAEDEKIKKTATKIKKTIVKEKCKGRLKEPVKTGEPSNKKQRLQKRNKKKNSSEDDVSDTVLELSESDNDYNVEDEFDNIEEYEEPNKNKKPECGNFVLVAFKGGKRMTTIYKYLCLVEAFDEEEMEIQVTSLKCMDSSKMLFCLNDNDKSDVPYEDVMGVIPEPRIILRGERMLYKFEKPVDVFEKP